MGTLDSGNLRYGEDYTLERYTFDDPDKSIDDRGRRMEWHHGLPERPEDWDRIRMVTFDYGDGVYRNIVISEHRPLDPLGSNEPDYEGPHKGGRYGPEHYYDLDDLAFDARLTLDS